jgi:hypothetical protein
VRDPVAHLHASIGESIREAITEVLREAIRAVLREAIRERPCSRAAASETLPEVIREVIRAVIRKESSLTRCSIASIAVNSCPDEGRNQRRHQKGIITHALQHREHRCELMP